MKKKIIFNCLGGAFLLVAIILFLQNTTLITGAIIGANFFKNINLIVPTFFFATSI